jgi:nucleotide-binding universal stress UspA family protein
MKLIRKILTTTDLSAFSAKGVRYAFQLAKSAGAEVIIAHALKTEEFLSHARGLEMAKPGAQENTLLERLVDQHKDALGRFSEEQLADLNIDLKVRQIVEMGEPQALIVNWAKNEGVDLIVMSTHGRSGLPRLMLGSVTERVIRGAPCPVLAIPFHEG